MKKRGISKDRQAEIFRQRYDKPKVVRFKEMDDCEWKKHFRMPKSLIYDQRFSLSALSLYPVLCSKANFEKNNWFQISIDNLATLAGLSPPTVCKSIDELTGAQSTIKIDGKKVKILEKKLESKGSRNYNIYRAGFVRGTTTTKGENLLFFTDLIDSGIWANLTKRARLFYLALRNEAKFDAATYRDIEYDEENQIAKGEFDFFWRKWDVCDKSRKELCNLVGIDSSDIYRCIYELEKYELIEIIDRWFKVWIRPKSYYEY